MATTRIKITAIHSDIPTKMYLQQFLLLRTCEKVGDEEVVNNYQLGKLNEAKSYGQIDFIKIKNEVKLVKVGEAYTVTLDERPIGKALKYRNPKHDASGNKLAPYYYEAELSNGEKVMDYTKRDLESTLNGYAKHHTL